MKHTERVRVNQPAESDDWHYQYQLQDDTFKRKHSPVLGYASWEDGIPRQEALANATLWAAAPHLLEACLDALHQLEIPGTGRVDAARAVLRAAIARATSEEK